MEANRIFSAEQIVVPPDLPGLLKDWTKEVIRKNPSDLLVFSANYFGELSTAANKGKLPIEELRRMRTLFDKYDVDGNGKMESKELKSFIKTGTFMLLLLFSTIGFEYDTIDLAFDISDTDIEKVIQLLDADRSGHLEFDEIVNWWAGEC